MFHNILKYALTQHKYSSLFQPFTLETKYNWKKQKQKQNSVWSLTVSRALAQHSSEALAIY